MFAYWCESYVNKIRETRLILVPRNYISFLRQGQIDHMAIRAWVAELSASGLAPATTTKAAQLLGKIMKSAVQAGLLDPLPLPAVMAFRAGLGAALGA